jgi:hypothetical protein
MKLEVVELTSFVRFSLKGELAEESPSRSPLWGARKPPGEPTLIERPQILEDAEQLPKW